MLNKTNASIVFIIALFLALAITVGKLRSTQEELSDYKEIDKYKNSQIDSFKNLAGQTITEAKAAQVNNTKIIEELSKEVFNLKDKNEKMIKEYVSLLRVKQKVEIRNVDVPFVVRDTVEVHPDSLVRAGDVVIPPKQFKDSTKDYAIDGTVLLKGVRINSITFTDSASFRVVEKKEGFLKKRETVVQGIHSNPYFKTEGMQYIQKRGDKPSRWQRWIKPVLGITAGIFLGSKL